MPLDWQLDFWDKDRYICNAIPKRQEENKDVPCSCILAAGSALRNVALPLFWDSPSAALISNTRLLICCAKAALSVCKGQGVGTSGIRSLVQGNQIHRDSYFHQICTPEWQGCGTDWLQPFSTGCLLRLALPLGTGGHFWGFTGQVLTSWLHTEHYTPHSFPRCCMKLYRLIFITVTEICRRNLGPCQFISIWSKQWSSFIMFFSLFGFIYKTFSL